jgi:hypothetical protein
LEKDADTVRHPTEVCPPKRCAVQSSSVTNLPLQLFKAAATHDGVKRARPTSKPDGGDDSSDDDVDGPASSVLAILKELAERLTEQDAVELLQMAADNQ